MLFPFFCLLFLSPSPSIPTPLPPYFQSNGKRDLQVQAAHYTELVSPCFISAEDIRLLATCGFLLDYFVYLAPIPTRQLSICMFVLNGFLMYIFVCTSLAVCLWCLIQPSTFSFLLGLFDMASVDFSVCIICLKSIKSLRKKRKESECSHHIQELVICNIINVYLESL